MGDGEAVDPTPFSAAGVHPGWRLSVAVDPIPLGARFGRLTLALVPVSIGVGRLWYLYVAPGPGIPYPYRSIGVTPTDVLMVLTCVGWVAWRVRAPSRLPMPAGTG